MCRHAKPITLPALALVAIIPVAFYLRFTAFHQTQPLRPPASIQSMKTTHLLGHEDSPLGLIIYSDFECPYCEILATTTFSESIRPLVSAGVLVVGFRHFPLESIHPLAMEVAAFADCASRQIDFWMVHDRLFTNPTQMDAKRRVRLFADATLDVSALSLCMSTSADTVRARDIAQGLAIGIKSTPTLLVGRQNGLELTVSDVLEGVPDPGWLEELVRRLHP